MARGKRRPKPMSPFLFAYIASILLIQVKTIYLPCCRYAKLYVPLHCFKNKKVEEYGRRT